MSFKKEPCRNFQRGHCRFGEACRYLHVTQQQPKSNVFGFGTQTGLSQQKKSNPLGFGTQTGSHQQQKSNPFGFGVQSSSHPKAGTDFVSKQNQSKLFQNTWTRSTSTPTGVAPQKSDNETQAANHKCTDPEACRRQIVEDFESERPLWKLTCYGHSKNAPCDIVGDISYEELRAAAYDDAKHGLNFQSIVERERNLLSSKLVEFDNLLRKPYAVPPGRSSSQTPFSGARPNSFPLTAQNSAPPLVSSFNQLGASQNLGLGISQSSNTFGTNNMPHRSEGTIIEGFLLCTLVGAFALLLMISYGRCI
ncbi:zinc finger CCCH domain-containing protein 16 isoform X3 [Juglans microcarpa x Juglans regia]|uniref:zinc finger CCCH domain-containing protein 16 isoform X3 n=1 Tax=Juglans microcarpa x Juglans regia TaxID=2249226 RepID=UPI001B7DEB05|nr:zinc finger CCCH domain-containing protein 16 isoform X3 [Juglans microcarpa x Juglans regia]